MADTRKITIALTQLDVMRRTVPGEVPEEQVEEYHSLLNDLEPSFGDVGIPHSCNRGEPQGCIRSTCGLWSARIGRYDVHKDQVL